MDSFPTLSRRSQQPLKPNGTSQSSHSTGTPFRQSMPAHKKP